MKQIALVFMLVFFLHDLTGLLAIFYFHPEYWINVHGTKQVMWTSRTQDVIGCFRIGESN